MTRVKLLEGKRGEDIAVSYLEKRGYRVIDRNFRLRNGEIDIIAIDPSAGLRSSNEGSGQGKKEQCLVFVEVKTRSSSQFGLPVEAITYFKLKALINAAQVYKVSHRGLPEQMRIDAISVLLQNGEPAIEHIKNISG